MDLGYLQAAFFELKASFSESLEALDKRSGAHEPCVDRGLQDIGAALEALRSTSKDQGTILGELSVQLRETFSGIPKVRDDVEEHEEDPKGWDFCLGSCARIVTDNFKQDISTAYWHVDWDITRVNCWIAYHLYHQGLFEVGDSFIREAQLSDAVAAPRSTFSEVHQILAALVSGKLEPALVWAAAHYEDVMPKLRGLQFLIKVQNESEMDALDHAQRYLAPIAHTSEDDDIGRLMGCIAFAGRLDQSPYFKLMLTTRTSEVAKELFKRFCRLSGHPYRSPLYVVTTVGGLVLPSLLHMAAEQVHGWQAIRDLELPEALSALLFHSVFLCPITYERATEWNPPIRLGSCGHVICQHAIEGILEGRPMTESIACPFCNKESTFEERKRIYF